MWEQLPLLAFRIWPWRYCAFLTHLVSFLFFFTILLFKLCIFVAKSEYCQFFESIVENISESWYIVIFLIIVKSSILIWDFWKLLLIWRYYQEETRVAKRRIVSLKRIYFIFYPALAAQWCSIDILLTAPLPPSGHIWILSPPVPSPNANPIICFSASELVYLKNGCFCVLHIISNFHPHFIWKMPSYRMAFAKKVTKLRPHFLAEGFP